MSELDSAVARFFALLNETPGFWQSIHLRVIATDSARGLSNLVTTAVLTAQRAEAVSLLADPPRSHPIAAFEQVRPFSELAALFQELKQGTIAVGPDNILCAKWGADGSQRAYDWSYASRATTLPRPTGPGSFDTGHVFAARGDTAPNVF